MVHEVEQMGTEKVNFDIAIIGGGVTGCSIARELSKCTIKACVIEKNTDIGEGTSKANSGIVHGGFDAEPGSLKAKLNIEGAGSMAALSKELDFPYKNNGSMVISITEDGLAVLEDLKARGEKNGVAGLEIISGNKARVLEPNLSKAVKWALHIPSSGIVCPFNLTVALGENAAENGVEFFLNTEVLGIDKPTQTVGKDESCHKNNAGFYEIRTDKANIRAKMIINAAGVYGDFIHNMVASNKEHLIARRGEYCLYDKKHGDFTERTIFQLPSKLGKGVLVTPTVHGNMMIGPNAFDIDGKEGNNTSKAGLDEIMDKARHSVEALPPRSGIITSFAGLRAHSERDDFIIENALGCDNFIDVIGIESPGLSCAPAIGPFVVELVKKSMRLEEKPKGTWNGNRKGFTHMEEMTFEERAEIIAEDGRYGNIICRCESVSEGEIIEAINRPLGATTLDGIKRRVRGGSGRCQGGFCMPKVMEILARELNVDVSDIHKSGNESQVIFGNIRDIDGVEQSREVENENH